MSWIGVLKGVAYGDSWGDQHEFMTYDEIFTNGFPYGPDTELFVTDDTQMTLFLADAIEKADELGSNPVNTSKIMKEAFIDWYRDPDNVRAPGETCINAIKTNLIFELDTKNDSKGNGSLMRVWPCAFAQFPYRDAIMQSELTHHHPVAGEVCGIAVPIIIGLERGTLVPGELLAYARSLATHPDIIAALDKAIKYLPLFNYNVWYNDICQFVGEGWVAEEALALALMCVDLKLNPIETLQRAVVSGGDSDTIGAITGGFLGAAYGDIWPEPWMDRLEPRYRDWINKDWKLLQWKKVV